MNIWLITVGEPLPIDIGNQRLYRTGILAQMLGENGHNVIWWTSSVNHMTKKQRFSKNTGTNLNDKYQIKIIYSIIYKKNISLSRIINHYLTAKKFAKWASQEQTPDIILCSFPTLSLSAEAVRFGKLKNIPVVLDIRDLWPDIFVGLVPVWAKKWARLVLNPAFRFSRLACKNANAIFGITPAFVDWGISRGERQKCALDRDFPLAYSDTTPGQDSKQEAKAFWFQKGLRSDNSDFNVCFFGTIGQQFELETVIKAAKIVQSHNKHIKFTLCGTGDKLAFYENMASDCFNIVFPGWVQSHHIWTLMRLSCIGLAPYHSSEDFMKSLPNKSLEYLSAGLPIVSSLKGTLQELLEDNNCGITYENGNEEQLAEILLSLYEKPEILRTMSENAFALYQERFVAEKVYSDMIDHLELICKEYKRSGGK